MNIAFKHTLKTRAHHLKPVVLLGNKGLTEAVIKEIDLALTSHELIKIKLNGTEKAEKADVIKQITGELNAELIQSIGNVAVLYRKNPA